MKTRLRIIPLLLIACMLAAPVAALAEETGQAGVITDLCTVTMPEPLADKAYRITDELVETYAVMPHGTELTVTLPEGGAGHVVLMWYELPERYTFEQLDAAGNVLSDDGMQPYYNAYYPLAEGTAQVRMTFARDAKLSTFAVYAAGELPEKVQVWEPSLSQADMLIVASSPRQVLREFGSAIVNYRTAHDVPMQVAVLSTQTRTDLDEMLAVLWAAGMRNYPTVGSFVCDNNESYKFTLSSWGKGPTLKYIASLIGTLSPGVVLTHLPDAAAPDGASRFTGEYTALAVEEAAFDGKLYHADAAGGTVLPIDVPLNAIGGETAEQMLAALYALTPSRHQFSKELNAVHAYRLAHSAVGSDAAGNDLLENVTPSNYTEPTPKPTATPEPTATPAPTAEPAPTSAPQADAAPERAGQGGVVLYAIPAAGLAVSVVLFLLLRRTRVKFLAILPLLVSVAVMLLLMQAQSVNEPAPAATPTATPMAEVTPAPTAEPAEQPAGPDADADTSEADAAAAPSADDAFFRQAGEDAEVIVSDYDTGHWEYRSDVLSVLVDRTTTELDGEPLVYFTAHIRMRELDTFRAGQSAETRNGLGVMKPWLMSRLNKAVLLITGDNIIHMDSEYKSILIRDGKVFLDEDKCDTLAMYPDMSMRIIKPYAMSAEDLLQDGVRQSFSFGPTLVVDGAVQQEADGHRLNRRLNPRTGLGMVEPGHFVAIVADGRQPDYSMGMRLLEFAQLFVDEGCEVAYNLDGGVSACMVFMGEQLNHHGRRVHEGTYMDTYQRNIPDGLIWGYSELVPGEDDPVEHNGEGR